MSYFSGVKIGDRVWSFEYGWGVVVDVCEKLFSVDFGSCDNMARINYTFDGKVGDQVNQTLFWDEIKFILPSKPVITLKFDYSDLITHKYYATPNTSLEQMKKFARLLSLRDQECPDSRGFMPRELDTFYCIKYDVDDMENKVLKTTDFPYEVVPFKTAEDAQKICDILNSERFEL